MFFLRDSIFSEKNLKLYLNEKIFHKMFKMIQKDPEFRPE